MFPSHIVSQRVSTLPFAAAIVAGTALSLFACVSEDYLAVAAILFLLITFASFFISPTKRYSAYFLLLFFVILAWHRADHYLARDVRWSIHEQVAASDSVWICGRIVIPAYDSWNRSHVLVDNALIEGADYSIQLGGMRARVYADSNELMALRSGDIICAIGRLRSSSEKTARFSGALTGALSNREVCDVYVKSDCLFEKHVSGYAFRRAVDRFRYWIIKTFNENLSPDAAALCRALVLGDRQDFGYRFQQQLKLTGLSHIFALSGLNTGLIISMLWLFLGVFFLPRNIRYVLLLLGALLYMELGREVPSLIRATLMCSSFLIGRLLQRRTLVINHLAIALGIELLWRPMDLVDPGFALSYLAVLGMIGGYSVMRQAVSQLVDQRSSGIMESSAEVLTGTLTAQVGTLPLVGFFFHRIPLLGGLGNLIVVPGFALLLLLASLMLFIAGVIPSLVQFITPSIEWLSSGLSWTVDFFANLPLSGIQIFDISFAMLLVLYILIFSIPVFWLLQRKSGALKTALLLACIVVWWGNFHKSEPSKLTFIDVGNGDACLIETEGRSFLIDAGPRYGEWSAANIIIPYFADRGIAHLDGLILTHPDSDHIGGAAELIQRITIDHLWTNGDSSLSRSYIENSVAARLKGVSQGILRAGDILRLSADAKLIVLTPDSMSLARYSESNRKSLAMVLKISSNSAFLSGDIDSTIESGLLTWGKIVDVDLLHAGHHGSKYSSSTAFLKATSPELCVLTAGRRNIYGHPAVEVLQRLTDLNIPYLITGKESTIVFESTDSGWNRVEPRAQALAKLWSLPYG